MYQQFLSIVAQHLPLAYSKECVSSSTVLEEMGLDSLSMVSLIIDLEDSMGILFPDSSFSDPGALHDVASLWALVSELSNSQSS